jgi:hypothetical protein
MMQARVSFRFKAAVAVLVVGALGCSTSNAPTPVSAGSGGANATPGTGGSTAPGSGGTTAGSASGGATAPGSGGAAVSASGGATAAESGGAAGPGSGGATGSGTGGAGGATLSGNGGSSSAAGMFSPSCDAVPLTAAGTAPNKGGACTATDPQLCYKTCGPQSVGFKSETCTGGAYAEMSGCSFPTGADYSCFKIPTTVDPTCPTSPPQASQPCAVAACVVCNVGGNYLDSTGASKQGYCVCPSATGGKWTCASGTAWPCPAGQGC